MDKYDIIRIVLTAFFGDGESQAIVGPNQRCYNYVKDLDERSKIGMLTPLEKKMLFEIQRVIDKGDVHIVEEQAYIAERRKELAAQFLGKMIEGIGSVGQYEAEHTYPGAALRMADSLLKLIEVVPYRKEEKSEQKES